jgi:trimethylamine--corrinoid protein Co-methyltransferase
MRPKLELLEQELVERIVGEAYELLWDPGVRVHREGALRLLAEGGATVDFEKKIARIPQDMIEEALETAPASVDIYDLKGEVRLRLGGDNVYFYPGATALKIIDPLTDEYRPPVTEDLVRFIQVVEGLPQIDAQAGSLLCADVPKMVSDSYRYYLMLLYGTKPLCGGAFSIEGWYPMKDLLVAYLGSEEAIAAKPVNTMAICPSPPLLWSEITCQNLMDCARWGLPAVLISMPLAGATAPVTIAGAVVQHTAESLSGVVIHQLVNPGAPIIYGGSPSMFDMREGTTPMGSIETVMINCANVQVGKYLGLPTHGYVGLSDAKIVDAQAGLESAMGAVLGALAGINLICGAGMSDFESGLSFEKVVIDAEVIGMAKRLLAGIEAREESLATALMRQVGHHGDFLSTEHTRRWFREEQYIPSAVIDRASQNIWENRGAKNIVQRARERAQALIAAYQPPDVPAEVRRELKAVMTRAAKRYGMEELPPLPE